MATGDSTHPGPGAQFGAEPGAESGPKRLKVDELLDEDSGRWQITTQTSLYVIDLDHRTVTRFTGAAGDPGIDPQARTAYPVNVLEDDGQPQPIWLLVQCQVGERMYLYTNVDATNIAFRGTTPVREIRRLTAEEGRP